MSSLQVSHHTEVQKELGVSDHTLGHSFKKRYDFNSHPTNVKIKTEEEEEERK